MIKVLEERKVRARKEHRCDYCGDRIRTGTPHLYQRSLLDDFFYSWRAHLECDWVAATAAGDFQDDEYGLTAEAWGEALLEKHGGQL